MIGTPILVLLYMVRLTSLFRRKSANDLPPAKSDAWRGVLWSYLAIFMPWSMESTRRHWSRYLEFVLFHLGAFSSILASFLIAYGSEKGSAEPRDKPDEAVQRELTMETLAPSGIARVRPDPRLKAGAKSRSQKQSGLLSSPLREVFGLVIGLGLISGLVRLIRRFSVPHMRIISTPDDYCSMGLTLLFMGSALPSLYGSKVARGIYSVIALLFLIYEPFSKIRHYIYYPFARYFHGTALGKRGVLKSPLETRS